MSQLLFSFSASDKIQHRVMKWFQIQISFSKEIHLLCQRNLCEPEQSAGTLQCAEQSNHLNKINHSNNSCFVSVLPETDEIPSCPPKLSLICHDQSSLHQMKHCVQSFGSISILAAAEKTSHCCCFSEEEEEEEGFWKRMRYPVVCV